MEYEPPPHLPRRAATLFLALGLAISVSFIPANFPSKSREPVNVGRVLCIFGVAGICASLGYLSGKLIVRSRHARARAAFSRNAR